ncbi:MAG: DUF58 domain-containing protein, partial [Chloroflexia bacterium]
MTYYWVVAGVVLATTGLAVGNYVVATLGLLLPVGVLVAWLWARYALDRLEYARTLSIDRLYAGERVELVVSLTNNKLLPVAWVVVEDRLDSSAASSGDSYIPPEHRMLALDPDRPYAPGRWEIHEAVSLSWYERVSWSYSVLCPRRGVHRIGPTMLRSGDPFGFYERERRLSATLELLVYPRLIPIEELGLSNRFPFEGARTGAAILDDLLNIVGARPYSETDTVRQVHWRASARGVQLQSKVLRPTTELSVVLFLDLASNEFAWQGAEAELTERAISATATIAHRIHAARWSLGLYVNGLHTGTHERVRIGPSRGDDSLARVMEVLARAPVFPTMKFSELLRTERRRLPTGATVVAVTAAPTREVRE